MAAWVEATTREMGQSLINPDKPSVSASALPGDNEKPALGTKPHLMPKPFALQRNATVRPIRAPKTNFSRQLHRAASSEALLDIKKPGAGDPNPSETIKSGPNGTVNGSNQIASPKTVPADPKLDLLAKSKPEPIKSHGSNNQTGPNSKPAVTTEDVKDIQPRSRAKSLGAHDQKILSQNVQGEVAKTEADVKVSSRCWPPRNRLSVELTSKFESLSQPEKELKRDAETSKTEREWPPHSPAESKPSKLPVDTVEIGEEDISGGSIKRRISLLFDRSTAAQHRDTFKKKDNPAAEISVDIKQRIQNLSLDVPRTHLPSTGGPKSPPSEKTLSTLDETPNERSSEKPAATEKVSADKLPGIAEIKNSAASVKSVEEQEDVPIPVSRRVGMSLDAETKRREEEEKQRKDEQLEKERQQQERERLLEEERKARELERQKEEERKRAEEKRKQDEEKQRQMEERRKQEEEQKRRIEEERKEEERRRQAEKDRERQIEEEKRRIEEEKVRLREEERLKKEKELEEERMQKLERQREEERLRQEREKQELLKKEREMEERKRMEEERLKEEERLREEREKERIRKEKEMEEERRKIQEIERQREEERLRQEREKEERLKKQREMEERKRMEEERLKEEERLRQEREMERIRKEKEMEEERQRIQETERQREEERLRKERELERINKEKEMERLRQERELERLRKEREIEERKQMEEEKQREEERLRQEKERLKKEKEMEDERKRLQELERQKEEERLRQERERERLKKEKEMEEERRRLQELERQKEEERLRQERERERLRKEREIEERKRMEEERQREEERLRQERERERLKKDKEMEEERRRLQELERQKEEERLRQERERERLKKEKEMEEERRRHQELEKQKEEERLRQARERERLRKEREIEERKQMEEERQREEERLRQERERERLKKEKEMEEERRRLQELERQKEEERMRQERERERLRKEREIEERKRMEEERQREEERLRQERERERLKKEKEMQEERRRTQEIERVNEEKRRQEREHEMEMETCEAAERFRKEVPTSYDLILFDAEEPAASQTLISTASPHLTQVTYDDFSVKPRRWGTRARRSSTPSPSRETPAAPYHSLQPESQSSPPGPQVSSRDQVSVYDLIGFEPEASRPHNSTDSRTHTYLFESQPGDLLEPETHEGQLKDGEPEEDEAAEQDTENLIVEVNDQTENDDAVDDPATQIRINQALQRLSQARQRNKSTDSDSADVPDQEELEPLPVLQSAAPLLDSSVFRSKVDLAKKRSIKRTRPSRAVRQRAALPAVTEGTQPDWRFCDSTDAKDQISNGAGSESEEEPSRDVSPPPAPSQPKRVPVFPGMDPSVLMAQLKRRSGVIETSPAEAQTPPPVPSRSPRTPTMALGPRVLPPVDAKDSGSGSSPSWLLELKSKKRMSQPESEA